MIGFNHVNTITYPNDRIQYGTMKVDIIIFIGYNNMVNFDLKEIWYVIGYVCCDIYLIYTYTCDQNQHELRIFNRIGRAALLKIGYQFLWLIIVPIISHLNSIFLRELTHGDQRILKFPDQSTRSVGNCEHSEHLYHNLLMSIEFVFHCAVLSYSIVCMLFICYLENSW